MSSIAEIFSHSLKCDDTSSRSSDSGNSHAEESSIEDDWVLIESSTDVKRDFLAYLQDS